jgi:pyruvate formate lyase activating enzyme
MQALARPDSAAPTVPRREVVMQASFPRNRTGSTVATRYWHRIPGGRVQCDACPRFCALREGQRGLCFVRARASGRIVLLTWGRSSGFCVDPIEKKPLHHFLPGTATLSFGTEGCNLSCRYCQNWDISKSREVSRLADEASPERIASAAVALGCASVAFTYNDPTIFLEYASDAADACHEAGLRAVAVTAGYICEQPRADFYRHIDAANVDLKAFTEKFYREVCGGHLQPVLDTLVYLKEKTSVWVEITNLVIPGFNDSEEETRDMCRWIVGSLGPEVPVHFTAFHPDWKMRDVPPTPASALYRAREIALAEGIRYAYTGNIPHEEGSTTFCHGCGAVLIGRDGYDVTQWNLEHGRCAACGRLCAGVFEAHPGQWGARRLPVRLAEFAA